MSGYSSLFQPFSVGSITVKNRIVQCPMDVMPFVDENMQFAQRYANILKERAKGGVGLIITGSCLVEDFNGRMFADVRDAFVPQAGKMTKEIHDCGAKIFCQLSAGVGRNLVVREGDLKGNGPFLERNALAPSDGVPNVWEPSLKHRALGKERIKRIVDGFADTAQMLKEAGFDGIEVHALHEGYLLDQFAIASINHREDEYGGSLENRLRFPQEILKAVKKRCGSDFPVIIRLSGESKMKGYNKGALPGETYQEFGRGIEECAVIARMLETMGYDALNMDNGSYDAWYWAHPPVYMPMLCNMKEAEKIKEVVSIPVFCAGKMNDPKLAAQAVAEGKIDAVAIGRALLADAQWPNKVRRGETRSIRPCIACQSGCMQTFLGRPLTCALNPRIGCEGEGQIPEAGQAKNVLVAGGGIGGMEAARTAALRGHHVCLMEKSERLGGVFVAAAMPAFKAADKELIAWYVNELDRLNVRVLLSMEVTPDVVESERPDAVIVCAGAQKKKLRIPGSGRLTDAVELLEKGTYSEKNVVVIGGGLTGCEIAYDAARQGKNVTILEMAEDILQVDGLCRANSNMLRDLLHFYHVSVRTSSSVEQIAEKQVNYIVNGKRKTAAADIVVSAIGYLPDTGLYDELKARGWETHLAGDAKQPGNLMSVIHEAYEIAMEL
nr:FAD-dependent oxidoreductase [uncultured Christensenella sp.]